jgi:uncharacterized radical SAM superfamily Fe-S cluster-containing enzyme
MNYYELEPKNNTFHEVVIDVTHRCNMTCKNCYIPNRDIPDMDITKMLEAISQFPKRVVVRIIGAEPTMRKDLPDIINGIRALGHHPVLLTNGLRFANKEYADMIGTTKLKMVYISLNGVDRDDWYETIDEMRCATKKIAALENLHKNKFLIDTGTIIVKGVNDDAISRLLSQFNRIGITDSLVRIKNIGDLGRNMVSTPNKNGEQIITINTNYTLDGLVNLVAKQTGLTADYIYSWKDNPIYTGLDPEETSILFPLVPINREEFTGSLGRRRGIWFKITDWGAGAFNEDKVPFANNTRRGRLTSNFKIAPFFEHVKLNEFGY